MILDDSKTLLYGSGSGSYFKKKKFYGSETDYSKRAYSIWLWKFIILWAYCTVYSTVLNTRLAYTVNNNARSATLEEFIGNQEYQLRLVYLA